MPSPVQDLQQRFSALPEFAAIMPRTTSIAGVSIAVLPLLMHVLHEREKRTSIVVMESEEAAEEMHQAISYFRSDAERFPAFDTLPYSPVSPSRDVASSRLSVLWHLAAGTPLIVTSIRALMRRTIARETFMQYVTEITPGMKMDRDALRFLLTGLGYVSVNEIEAECEFAVRGGIVDIYSPAHHLPVRIEFFDDVVESVRLFSAEDQRSATVLDRAFIIPAHEAIYDAATIQRAFTEKTVPDTIREHFARDPYFGGAENYLPLFHMADSLFSWQKDARVYWYEGERSLAASEKYRKEIDFLFKQDARYAVTGSSDALYLSDDEIKARMRSDVRLAVFGTGRDGEVRLSFGAGASFKANIKGFTDHIRERMAEGQTVNLVTSHREQADRFVQMLAEFAPPILGPDESTDKTFFITVGNLSEGFISREMNYTLMVDREVFGRRKKTYKRTPSARKSVIESFVDLSPGDYVVHVNHGIGRYQGLTRLTAAGKEKDYLLIEYAKDDKLYIPVEQINFIQKYMSAGAKADPKLDILGGKAWDKVRERARKSAEKIAAELIKIYTIRHALEGYGFPKDTAWQDDFEAAFPYQETPDQLRAVADIKSDMETPKVMDRLVCGDVGFGKTEVALRAAFKSIMAGKQVALLCPTTVLSQQHFRTARERFREYPVRIGLLNRFRAPKETRDTVLALKKGEVDLLIGTHRILAEDVVFKDLGLVIVDEEQRFGVKQKEALKRYKVLVDVLTMTATPIPRTLNLALTQIRDISVIETPPLNRLPIQTYVIEFDEETMAKAIRRELARGGQVFVVYNRVQSINEFAVMLGKLVPEAVIGIGHGQMEGHELEDIMNSFVEGEYNVLVSTSIIENGIDIANCNTIIIYRADLFGLAELYQLRGRVGRSDREAYAFFFFPGNRVISEDAYKRLTAIAEHTDLGSGFKIAMRDLEIRGAGNVLGREQSGNIHAVGYELYTQLLEESVSKMKGEIREVTFDTVIDLRNDIFIPDTYVNEPKQKIEIYKNILRVENEEDIDAVHASLVDRYGKVPEAITHLFEIARLKAFLKRYKIVSVIEGDYNLYIKCNDYSRVDHGKMKRLSSTTGSGVYPDKKDLNQLVMPVREDTITWKVGAIRTVVGAIAKS
ncbi:MAG: transcription-repair coupling factor [Spirochaetota bacterium]